MYRAQQAFLDNLIVMGKFYDIAEDFYSASNLTDEHIKEYIVSRIKHSGDN